jgi:Fic family protein
MTLLLPYDEKSLKELYEELDAWTRRLDHRGPLPRVWVGRIRRELEAKAVAASTSMEGVPVTVEEVRRILAGERPPDVKPEDRDLVQGYRDAMSFVLRRADDPAFGWNRELIVALHDRILAGKYSQGAGRLRTERPAYVVNSLTRQPVFLPPPGEQVPGLIDEACRDMDTSRAHPAVASAWIHVAIAAIHPFRDGNGRSARVLASLAMYLGGFKRPEFTSLEEWWGRHLADYYRAFSCLGSTFTRDADVTPFLRAHIQAQLRQIRALDAREWIERQVWTALEEAAEDFNVDRRVANALWDAFFGRDVTAGYYRSLADVSPATATKDLASLVTAGLLRAEGRRRGRRYLSTDQLYVVVGATLFIDVSGPSEVAREVIVSELSKRRTLTGEAFGFPRPPYDSPSP